MLLKLFAVVALVSAVFALPPNPAAPDLTPWTNLGISLEDAATFFEDGTSPLEGHQLIQNEKALFSGKVARTVRSRRSLAFAIFLNTVNADATRRNTCAQSFGRSVCCYGNGTRNVRCKLRH